MTETRERRLNFITETLANKGKINRRDIQDAMGCTDATATLDLKIWAEQNPGKTTYSQRERAYVLITPAKLPYIKPEVSGPYIMPTDPRSVNRGLAENVAETLIAMVKVYDRPYASVPQKFGARDNFSNALLELLNAII